MEGTYDVMLGSQKMGSVSVKKQGLYWQFDCKCNLSGEVMCDLAVRIDDRREKIGLLIPECGIYCLKTKLPIKRIGQGIPVFTLQPRHGTIKGHFIPVNPDEPFRYLNRLENAFLAKQNRQVGIVMMDEK